MVLRIITVNYSRMLISDPRQLLDFFSKTGVFFPNMVRIRSIHCCVLICIKRVLKSGTLRFETKANLRTIG